MNNEQQDKEYNFKFTITEINYIISGLQEMPTKIAVPIINKIHAQYNPQAEVVKQ